MDIKTVDDSNTLIIDDLYQRQQENASKMRTALLAAFDDTGISTRQAIQGITGMRIYHQLMRIIRYTQLMDKLEEKLYESIEYSIDSSQASDPSTWMGLLSIQERLQKSMIESHKLLQPYLNIQELSAVDLSEPEPDLNPTSQILTPEDRDKIRSNAQAVIQQLQLSGGDNIAGE